MSSMGCNGSTIVDPTVSEITLDCSDGIQLAGQSWKIDKPVAPTDSKGRPVEELNILCLHGWMDNCRTFFHLAPGLISRLDARALSDESESSSSNEIPEEGENQQKHRVHVVALDLPGHGLSSHKSQDAPPMVCAEFLFYVAEAVRLLKWWDDKSNTQKKIVLIGHSMGASIALLYAAAFPEQTRQLILLDSVGNVARPAETASEHLRAYIQARQRDGPLLLQPENRFYYPTWEAALKARCRSPAYFPGNQYISEEAARELVSRGLVEGPDPDAKKQQQTSRTLFRFRHDPRLQWSSLQYFSIEQLESLYRDIRSPTCVLLAKDGWPIDDMTLSRVKEILKPTTFCTRMHGSHHLHADPETAENVVDEIVHFLQL